jgi:predicted membrane metal-binding protein
MKKQENTITKQTGKKLWLSPWSYNESFIIAGTLIVLGFIVELVFQQQQVPIPHRPYNLIILFTSIVFLAPSVPLYPLPHLYCSWVLSGRKEKVCHNGCNNWD